ncbi:CHAT domain-containing protein [Dactylosporangium darangshiense]|uniref:CHAT domain-containing protein n=1 Tax=Dactylosporangium darangshiense TaxID=579108 RepID=A0ABP8CYC8_9ACTN
MADRSAQDIDRRTALAREWDELVQQVRGLDGFEDFLRPPRLADLLPAARGGPVIILNVSRWRCDALIVTTDGVNVVELPKLTHDEVTVRVEQYLGAVGAVPDDASLKETLAWMWEAFAERVLDHLGYTSSPSGAAPWPRVWWCPTGALALLPIHAAGRHDADGQAVMDRVVSSYTPTLRALLEARGGGPARPDDRAVAGPGRVLFVGLEQTLVEQLVPAERRTVLSGSDATRAAALSELVRHAWVHFGCHGDQDLDDPLRAAIHLHDGELTVNDFPSAQYRGELAYLSGCRAAAGGTALPDETITLAAALHYTGYRHVVATLWSAGDRHAAQVAAGFYETLIGAGTFDATGAAQSLHSAVRGLRQQYRDQPSVWAPFAHTGP